MAHVKANGIQIEYEGFGKNIDPAIVLIAGNGAQLNFWESDYCEMLAKENLRGSPFKKNVPGGIVKKAMIAPIIRKGLYARMQRWLPMGIGDNTFHY